MTTGENSYQEHIDRSYRQHTRLVEWAKLRIYILATMILITTCGAAYWYYYYGFSQTIAANILVLGAVVMAICTLICAASNSAQLGYLAQRNAAEDLLHFDLYQSNQEALSEVLREANQHFDQGRRKVDSLAALVAETETVSARYMHFKSRLDNMHGDMQTADKLRELIRLELRTEGLDDSNASVVAFLDRNSQLPRSSQ